MKIGSRLSSVVRHTPAPIWRALAVIVLAALAGLAAIVALSDDPKIYERQSSFVIRPSETVPPEQLPDVVGALAPPVGGVTPTIVNILGSARLTEATAVAAGLPPESVGESGAKYSLTASQQAGSAVVDIKLTGPSDAKLLAMQAAIPEEAATLVGGSFGLFRLESLNASTSTKQVGPKTAQTTALAVLLGALVGITLVLIEGRLRSSLGTRTFDREDDGRPAGAEDPSGEPDQLESTLRDSLETGAFVRRVGPGRIEVTDPEAPPEPESERPRREAERPKRETERPKRQNARRKRETTRRKR
jgi:hypothetical protein